MPYFHALAVFEVRESSAEGADRAAAALLKAIRHPRVLLYEHDTSGGLGPYASAAAMYFSVLADFDVEAQTEERAADLVEEVLEDLSTDTIQFLAVGLTPGERRVAHKAQPEEERRPEQGGRDERGGKGRRPRGRGKKREAQRETEVPREDTPLSTPEPETVPPAARVGPPSAQTQEPARVVVQPTGTAEAPVTPLPRPVEVEAPLPPPRSSPSMRVTLSVSLHVSELIPQFNGSALPEEQELLTLALAEARRRYPELPAGLTPDAELVSHPWGETILTLTWRYDVPVPSAEETK
ncbi:MAG: hypothetical protein AB1671_21785 [Thermodesulfobacteriota bacterium]